MKPEKKQLNSHLVLENINRPWLENKECFLFDETHYYFTENGKLKKKIHSRICDHI